MYVYCIFFPPNSTEIAHRFLLIDRFAMSEYQVWNHDFVFIFQEMKEHFSMRPPGKDVSCGGSGGGSSSPAHRHLISESESIARSPQRPSSLNVTPVYNCDNHLPSGQLSHYLRKTIGFHM